MAFSLPSTMNGSLGSRCTRKALNSKKEALYHWYFYQPRNKSSISISASKKGRGFGPEKKKTNNVKTTRESRPVGSPDSQKRKSTFGQSDKLIGQAPGIASGSKEKSSNIVFNRRFEERLEAVRRSALEQKKVEEKELYQAIDYDAPVEKERNTISIGTKVGVGIAVVVFGLVFALGDFLPSVSPDEKATTAVSKLTEEEASALKARLQQYEAILAASPEDPTALEGASVTLAELGEYNRATSLLEKFIKERPKDSEAYRLLGEVKFELKDYQGSADAYKAAASASESIHLGILRGLTNALLAANKPDEAVKTLLDVRESLDKQKITSQNVVDGANNSVEETPVDPVQVELLLGKAYSDWGHVSDAVSVYDKLIATQPNDFRGYLAKGIILKENGNSADAERMFIQARFFAPEKAKALVDQYAKR